MIDCVLVVVRMKVNSGTFGLSVAPVGAGCGAAPSSLIFSFFFNKSLSVMLYAVEYLLRSARKQPAQVGNVGAPEMSSVRMQLW
jgi:hypothetical protein